MISRRMQLVVTDLALITVLVFAQSWLTTQVTAQTTRATILGTVTNEKGELVPNAKVTAKNVDTNITRETTTDDAGLYRFPELVPGNYEVRVEVQGFAPDVRGGIDLTVGREAVIDIALKVGELKEQVVVQDAPLVQTTTSEISYLVSRKQIEELPLNGRDVLQLATLHNGIISTSSNTDAQAEVGAGTTRLTVNGGRLDFNAYFLDGTETSDAFGNSPGGLGGGFLGVDALREFQVLASNYSAEYGQGGGAIFNAVTKSGTNDLHGTAFEFLRNSALDARNFFNAQKLPFQRNQFGGSLGGPIIRDRTFIFGSYEGLRRREGTSTIFNVPSPNARQGILVNPPANFTGINPAVLPYLALFPLPNGPISGDTGVYRRDFKESTNEDFFVVRLDHKLTDKHSVFGRYTIDDSDLTGVNTNAGVIQQQELTNRNQYVALEALSLFTSEAINSLRFGFNRSNFGSAFPFSISVPDSLAFLPGHPMGATVLSGLSDLRPALTASRSFVLNTYEVNDNFVYTMGDHSLKFGGMVRWYQLNANSPLLTDAAFLFNGGVGGFLQGGTLLLTPQPGTDFYRNIRQRLYGLYVQDDWKVRRNLTLNLGLRYEPYSTPSEANGKDVNFRNFTDTTSSPPPYIENPSHHNFGPRVGFAYDPTGDGRWAVRGAFGVFYSAILPMRYRFQISAVPPFANLIAVPAIPGCAFPNTFNCVGNINFPLGMRWNTEFHAEQPTIYQWNGNVQREISRNFVVQAGYVGSRGIHLETGFTSNVRRNFSIVNGQKFFPGTGPRINPNFNAIQLLNFNGDAYYHAMQLTATKRYAKGLQFQLAYTWAKSLDTNSATDSVFTNGTVGSDAQDPYDTRAEKGLSDFDVRHNFVANFLYDLPFGKDLTGASAKFAQGWSVGGILNLRSGFPFNVHIGQGFDRARNGIDNTRSQRPNVASGRTYESAITGDPNRFVDPTAFVLQPAGFYGNEGRNVLSGPDLKAFDLTLIKETAITERVNMEFRTEVFNLFNHTNFAGPEANNRAIFVGVDANGNGIVPASFGQLTKTSTSSRQIQFGLKFIF